MGKYFSVSDCELIIDENSTFVNFINSREDGAIYSFEMKKFKELLKHGGKQWKIPSKYTATGYVELSFHTGRRHISNKGGDINTYFKDYEYKLMMQELEEILSV